MLSSLGGPPLRIILINPPLDSVLRDGNVDPVTSYLFYNSASRPIK